MHACTHTHIRPSIVQHLQLQRNGVVVAVQMDHVAEFVQQPNGQLVQPNRTQILPHLKSSTSTYK